MQMNYKIQEAVAIEQKPKKVTVQWAQGIVWIETTHRDDSVGRMSFVPGDELTLVSED